MIHTLKIESRLQLLLISLSIALLSLSFAQRSYGQLQPQKPPKPFLISAQSIQQLSFGAITYLSSGTGDVTVYPGGGRTLSSGIYSSSSVTYFPAIIRVTGTKNMVFTIAPIPNATLTYNAKSMGLRFDITPLTNPSGPTYTITNNDGTMDITIGGRLLVGDITANPPGNYTGSFYITFIQQ